MHPKKSMLANSIGGPAGIRTRVWGSGGLYAIQAILRDRMIKRVKDSEIRKGGRGASPGIWPQTERERSLGDFPSLFVVELGVTAASAGGTVLVDCHEGSGSALGADGLGPGNGVALDLVCVLLLDGFLLCRFLCCHLNHSCASSSAGLSV